MSLQTEVPVDHLLGSLRQGACTIIGYATRLPPSDDGKRIMQAAARFLSWLEQKKDADFDGDFMHQLRTPINQIQGYTEMLMETVEDADVTRDLDAIHNLNRELLEQTNRLRDAASPKSATWLPEPASEASSGHGSLLVVDDNEPNLDLLSRRLLRCGYQVDGAVSGGSALDQAAKHRYDLILLDIMMPDINGLEVLRELRKLKSPSELAVIMVTGRDHSDDVVTALRLGANDYVTKPIDFPVLLARVQAQLNLLRLAELKDEFLSIASHDLKNPLTVILGSAWALQRMVPSGEPRELIDGIKMHADIMKRMINDFLDFEALQGGHFKLEAAPLDLSKLANDVVRNHLSYASSKGISLRVELADALPELSGDAARLAQVLDNLVGNAVKFSAAGSSAVVSVHIDNGAVLIEVIDGGPGLSDSDFQRLFVKYARLSNKPTGSEKSSGLGLYICKQLVEMHGGTIGAHNNKDGGGATFWVRLPLPG